MNFKNKLEQRCFETAKRALKNGVSIEHNKKVQIESALFPEVASFKGPPTKEVDVLIAELSDTPKILLLVSCKQLSRPAEPAHVQEWCAVVRTLNRYAAGTTYFGLVLSPTGFTSGCEAWATSHNVGIVPPLKGRRLAFNEETILRMFERVLTGLQARVRLKADDLTTPPAFFDFVYRLVSDFEGHQEAAQQGRYYVFPQGWVSSFGEMYSAVAGRQIIDMQIVDGATVVLTDGVAIRYTGTRVEFGSDAKLEYGTSTNGRCYKNIEMEPCTLDTIKSLAAGMAISSAADFGHCLEFGLEHRFNLGLHSDGFHLISMENPLDEHRL